MKVKYTYETALAELKETKQLNTSMLPTFGIAFESFLRYAQLNQDKSKELIDKLIAILDEPFTKQKIQDQRAGKIKPS